MTHILSVLELALIVAVLLLRRRDELERRRERETERRSAAAQQQRLRGIARNQSSLVELVRSSLRPPPPRCASCGHEHEHHFGQRGEQMACSSQHCACPSWVDTHAIDFADEATPTGGQ